MDSNSPGFGQLRRDFKARDAFIIAFVFISPIVALYAVFGLVLIAAGPAAWWAFVVVLVLQILLAGTLGVMVSRWPYEGGSYQWAKRLVGPRYGWATGWLYLWTLIVVIASGAYFVAGLVPALLERESFTVGQQTIVAILVLAAVTVLNMMGPAAVKIFTRASLLAEAIGSVGLATVLLIWHREQPLSIITTTGGVPTNNYLWMGFLFAIGVVGYSFAGFESVCSMAEEIAEPERHIPKAMIGAVLTIGAIVLYSSLALILAIPDLTTFLSERAADPAADIITAALGPSIARPFLMLILLGFIAALVAAQTSVSRVMWAFARDRSIPASEFLVKLSGRHDYPTRAVGTVGTLAGCVTLLAFSEEIYTTLISASTTGFFLTMTLVLAALGSRILQGRFEYGTFNFGRLTPVVVVAAGTWTTFQVVNLCWPRALDQPWHVQWAVPLGLFMIALSGFAVRFLTGGNRDAHGAPRRTN